MPGKAVLTAGALLLLAGCATTGGTGRPSLDDIFPPRTVPEAAAAEGEVSLSLGGRRVSLPGAVVMAPPASFRVDLLDPLDRPAAVLFVDGQRIVQYIPAAASAAEVKPLPAECGDISTGDWVPYAVAAGPGPGRRPLFKPLLWLGKVSFRRFAAGELREEIICGVEAGSWAVEKVTWYCGGAPVLRLKAASPDRGAGKGGPRSFTVQFPAAGLEMEFNLREIEEGAVPGEGLLRPVLPPGTRWTSFDLVQGR